MAAAKKSQNINKTRQRIINFLKFEGQANANKLAQEFGVSTMAIRQHLYALQEEGLVIYTEKNLSQGRPTKMWQLTTQADSFFPNGYADLTLSLIHSITETFGNEGLQRLLEVRCQEQKELYRENISENLPLEEKINILAELRNDEGYMAEVQSLDDSSWFLIEKHCPICAAATACTGLCDRELDLFQYTLGNDINIERIEHIVAGERRCVYKICEKK